MRMNAITRDFLMKVALAMPTTPDMDTFVSELANRGIGKEASEDEIERFDKLMEAA